MDITVTTVEDKGGYSHLYANSPEFPDQLNRALYMAVVAPVDEWAMPGATYGPSAKRVRVTFSHPWYTANQAAFLPCPVIVNKEEVAALAMTAARWHADEFGLYIAGLYMTLDDDAELSRTESSACDQ
jgi:hypothetical protein